MPIVHDPQEEEVPTGEMITGSGSSGVVNEGPSKSGSYTNLRSYLDANKGAGKQMAEQVSSGIQEQVGKTQEQLGNVQSQFQQNVQQGGVNQNQQMLDQLRTDPTQVNQQDFSRLRDATYQGPQSFGANQQPSYQQVQQDMGQIQQQADATQTGAGQRALLQDQYGRPSYGSGEQRLDQLFLQAPGESRQTFADLREQVGGLAPQLQQMQEQGTQDIAARQAETQATREGARTAIGGASTDYATQVRDALAARQAQRPEAQAALEARISGGQLTPEDYAAMGLETGTRTYNMMQNPEGMISNSTFDPTKAISQDEFARSQALAQLGGQDTILPFQSSAELAGTQAQVGFDQDGIQRALANAELGYQNAYNSSGNDAKEARIAAINANTGYYNGAGELARFRKLERDNLQNEINDWKRQQGYYNRV